MPGAEGKTRFACQRCTACCRWEGDVVLLENAVEKIAEFLDMPFFDFVRDYTRLRDNRTGLSLIDKEGSTECIMLDGNDCRLQAVKPAQCKGFPNQWNFPGWRDVCEAIEVPIRSTKRG